MGIFHSKRSTTAGRVTDTDKAILSLKTQRRKLTAEKTRLEALVAKGIEEAREYIRAKRRERALLSLRKNKLHEQTLNKIDAYLLNVEQVLANIEAAQRTNRLFAALSEGSAALAALQRETALEDVERLNEATEDAAAHQARLRDLLAGSLSAQDDAAALEELERIQAAQEREEAAQLPDVPATRPAAAAAEPHALEEDLPAVPTHEPLPTREPHDATGRVREEALAA